MTNDEQTFRALWQSLVAVAGVYSREVDEMQARVWFAALGNLELDAVQAALLDHAKHSKWMPTPAEIRVRVIRAANEAHAKRARLAQPERTEDEKRAVSAAIREVREKLGNVGGTE